mgnify:CR=1 FL=1
MDKKENRPDACTASGTASTICDYDSTFVSAGQDMTENELIRKVTEDYLAGIDVDIRPAPEQVERELLQATNNAIEATRTRQWARRRRRPIPTRRWEKPACACASTWTRTRLR